MKDLPKTEEPDKAPDGRDLSLQQLLDLWLTFPPSVRRGVLRGLWFQEEHLARIVANRPETSNRAFVQIAPTRTARWLLRAISKAMDPKYDLRADGTPNADPYRVHGEKEGT